MQYTREKLNALLEGIDASVNNGVLRMYELNLEVIYTVLNV